MFDTNTAGASSSRALLRRLYPANSYYNGRHCVTGAPSSLIPVATYIITAPPASFLAILCNTVKNFYIYNTLNYVNI